MTGLGTLDRSGKLYSVSNTVGDNGNVIPTSTLVGSVFLRRETPSARTVISGARDASQLEDIFVMRWIDGVKPGFQVEVESVRYRITRIDEIGRRIGWRVYCRIAELQ